MYIEELTRYVHGFYRFNSILNALLPASIWNTYKDEFAKARLTELNIIDWGGARFGSCNTLIIPCHLLTLAYILIADVAKAMLRRIRLCALLLQVMHGSAQLAQLSPQSNKKPRIPSVARTLDIRPACHSEPILWRFRVSNRSGE